MTPRALAEETIALLKPLSCQAIAAAREGETPCRLATDWTWPAPRRVAVGSGAAAGMIFWAGAGSAARAGAGAGRARAGAGARGGRLGRGGGDDLRGGRGPGRGGGGGRAGRELEDRARQQDAVGVEAVHRRDRAHGHARGGRETRERVA